MISRLCRRPQAYHHHRSGLSTVDSVVQMDGIMHASPVIMGSMNSWRENQTARNVIGCRCRRSTAVTIQRTAFAMPPAHHLSECTTKPPYNKTMDVPRDGQRRAKNASNFFIFFCPEP